MPTMSTTKQKTGARRFLLPLLALVGLLTTSACYYDPYGYYGYPGYAYGAPPVVGGVVVYPRHRYYWR